MALPRLPVSASDHSHVAGLAERIGVQVLVERQGQGASTVRVVAGGV